MWHRPVFLGCVAAACLSSPLPRPSHQSGHYLPEDPGSAGPGKLPRHHDETAFQRRGGHHPLRPGNTSPASGPRPHQHSRCQWQYQRGNHPRRGRYLPAQSLGRLPLLFTPPPVELQCPRHEPGVQQPRSASDQLRTRNQRYRSASGSSRGRPRLQSPACRKNDHDGLDRRGDWARVANRRTQ